MILNYFVWVFFIFLSAVVGIYLVLNFGLLGLVVFYLGSLALRKYFAPFLSLSVSYNKEATIFLSGSVFLLGFILLPILFYILLWLIYDLEDIIVFSNKVSSLGISEKYLSAYVRYVTDTHSVDVDLKSLLARPTLRDGFSLVLFRITLYCGIVILLALESVRFVTSKTRVDNSNRKLMQTPTADDSSLRTTLYALVFILLLFLVDYASAYPNKIPIFESFWIRNVVGACLLLLGFFAIGFCEWLAKFINLREG